MNINENLVSIKEAAMILGVTRMTLGNWVRAGYGPKRTKIGGRYFYKRNELQEFLNP